MKNNKFLIYQDFTNDGMHFTVYLIKVNEVRCLGTYLSDSPVIKKMIKAGVKVKVCDWREER